MDVSSSASPLAELIAALLHEAVTASRERYLAVFEFQLEARRRPASGARRHAGTPHLGGERDHGR